MENVFKKWWLLLIGGLLFLILGFVSMAHPMAALLSVIIYVGIAAVVSGLFTLIFVFSNTAAVGWGLIEGAVDLLFGVVMLAHPLLSASLIPVIVGIWVFIRGLMYLIDALKWHRSRAREWSGYAVIGVLLMVLGFLMVIDDRFGLIPVAYLLAAIFLFLGFAGLTVAFGMRRIQRDAEA